MSFANQVKALVIKDLQIVSRSRKSSICEIVAPLLAAVMSGLFVMLLTNLSTSGDEYSDSRSLRLDDRSAFLFASPYPTWTNLPATVYNSVRTLPRDVSANFSMLNVSVMLEPFVALEGYLRNATAFGLNATESGVVQLTTAAFMSRDPIQSSVTFGTMLGSLLSLDSSFARAAGITVRDLVLSFNLRGIFAATAMTLLIYGFLPAAVINGGRLVTEKSKRVRETLRVMGVSDAAYVVSHFTSMMLRMGVACCLIAFVLAAFKAIEVADIGIMLGLSFLFSVSLACQALLMPALFAVDVWSNTFCIFFVTGGAALGQFTTGSPAGVQMAVCLLSPSAFYYAVLPLLAKNSIKLNLSVGDAAMMLVLDSFVYLELALYIYSVFPGEYGVPKHPLYFISWIWERKPDAPEPRRADAGSAGTHERRSDELNDVNGEADNFIVVSKLVKQFPGSAKPAVDDLDLIVKRGEIFALLGHNGAGKTTTISMLTGILDSTSYVTAVVNGLDLRTQMNEIRRSIGLCPQFDVLFDDLSARQHLEFFGRLKGLEPTHPRIESLMSDLALPAAPEPCRIYSGGTRRRLSVANALVGGSALVLLDEPSSGMDPVSRRRMWNLIKAEKASGRTVILTTHFMEEADYLGDTIGIMSAGRMKCCASSTELKHRYDVGYTLTVTKGPRCDSDAVLHLVRNHVPDATTKLDSRSEIQMQVKSENVTPLLVDLESQLVALDAPSYGVDACTLEDVFVRLSAEEQHERDSHAAVAVGSPFLAGEFEEKFERLYRKAFDEVSSWSRIWFQTRMVYVRCARLLMRVMAVRQFSGHELLVRDGTVSAIVEALLRASIVRQPARRADPSAR